MELPEKDLAQGVTARQTGVQKLHRRLPLPCHVCSQQTRARPPTAEPHQRQLQPAEACFLGGGWRMVSSVGQGKLWLPARASKHWSLQHCLAAPFPPVRSAGLETLWVVGVTPAGGEASPKARQCRTVVGATCRLLLQHASTTGTSTTGKPSCTWVEFGPNYMAN